MCAIDVSPVVATERLTLRGPTPADAPVVARMANDLAVAGMTTSMPHPYTSADAEDFCERALSQDWSREARFAIEHRHFGVVGMLGFETGFNGRPQLGYWLGRNFWNRGYATEAVRAALKWVKRDWRKGLVEAGHFSDNPASGQVLCKAGFLYTGDVALADSRARGAAAPLRRMVWLA
jgi:RimJ/RimL family protein N-acetyltransferase